MLAFHLIVTLKQSVSLQLSKRKRQFTKLNLLNLILMCFLIFIYLLRCFYVILYNIYVLKRWFVMKVIDTHAHVWDDKYQRSECEIIEDFKNDDHDNIMIAVGTNYDDSVRLLSLDKKDVYVAIGIHPQFARKVDERIFDLIELNKQKIVAIGEIGLDYYYGDDYKKEQLILLRRQMALAEKLNLPVILHSRDASQDLLAVIEEYPKVRGVVHCFSDSLEVAQKLKDKGFFIGVGGSYTFHSNQQLRDVIKVVGLSNVVLETDSPYLAPVPFRGKVNKPQYVRCVAKAISRDLEMDVDDVINITNMNAYKLFGVKNEDK